MTVSELVAIGKRLEELERPKARERQAHGETAPGRNALGPETQSVDSPRHTSEVVGSALGISSASYKRARYVIDAIDDDNPHVAEVAKTAVEEMDAGGGIFTAYNFCRISDRPPGGAPPVSVQTLYVV
ncbi:MAG: hypothetical protein ACR2FE_08810 [Aeromicrobium sp.]